MASPKSIDKKYNPYGHTWLLWSKWIIKRDGYQCKICGKKGVCKYGLPYPQGWNKNWLYLIAHHIIPVSEGGMNNPKNLVSVCKSCHIKIHAGTVKLF